MDNCNNSDFNSFDFLLFDSARKNPMRIKRKNYQIISDDEESHENMQNNGKLKLNQMKFYERTGKWSEEEEQYANQIILKFQSGELDDCENGCTLRAYLARKLNCAPMRVSKKFAGRNIGGVSNQFHFEIFIIAYDTLI